MEKMNWVRPLSQEQRFEVNDYIATCYDTSGGTLSVSCNLYTANDGGHDENYHSYQCHQPTPISYKNQSGYEVGKAAPISNLVINDGSDDGSLQNGTHAATWVSTWEGITYYHVGTATVSGVTESTHS